MFVKLVTLQDAPFGNVDAYIHPDDIRRIITVDDNLRAHMGAPGDTMSIVVVRQYNNSEENVYTSLSPQAIIQLVRQAIRDRAVTITV